MSYFSVHDREALVRDAGEMLRALSFLLGDEALRVSAEGVYDEEMAAAVRHFQGLYGLPVTGRLDYESHTVLRREAQRHDDILDPGEAIRPFSPGGRGPVGMGERNDTVLLIQIILSALRQYYEFRERIPLSGVYDGATERAVREMERRYGLSETGQVGDVLWKRMVKEYNRTLAGYE